MKATRTHHNNLNDLDFQFTLIHTRKCISSIRIQQFLLLFSTIPTVMTDQHYSDGQKKTIFLKIAYFDVIIDHIRYLETLRIRFSFVKNNLNIQSVLFVFFFGVCIKYRTKKLNSTTENKCKTSTRTVKTDKR